MFFQPRSAAWFFAASRSSMPMQMKFTLPARAPVEQLPSIASQDAGHPPHLNDEYKYRQDADLPSGEEIDNGWLARFNVIEKVTRRTTAYFSHREVFYGFTHTIAHEYRTKIQEAK
jgi:hypothetical protein